MDKRWWLSWYQQTLDPRPLTCPPNKAVLGWWRTGQRASDEAWTLCALVLADGEDRAKAAVVSDWPEAAEWRFCDPHDANWSPGDRFPASAWMRARLEAKEEGGR